MGPRPMGGVPSVGVFLRGPNAYLLEFRRKPRKTPNDKVDKRDRGLNLAPPIFQFWALPLSHWWGEAHKREKMTEGEEFCASEGREVGEWVLLARDFSLRAERRNHWILCSLHQIFIYGISIDYFLIKSLYDPFVR